MRHKMLFLIGIGTVCAGWAMTSVARAEIGFQLVLRNTLTTTEVTVDPGGPFGLDLLAKTIDSEPGVAAELDSFAYRIAFPNQDFWLQTNAFGPPFDNVLAGDGGFNGSVPWAPPAMQITNGADFGSALHTPAIPDLYRTSASQEGIPGTGDDLLVETLELLAPMAIGDYPIVLRMLEAADATGAFHSTGSGEDFMVHVVPEPAAGLLLLLGAGMLRARRRR
jgi:hypothetical protein